MEFKRRRKNRLFVSISTDGELISTAEKPKKTATAKVVESTSSSEQAVSKPESKKPAAKKAEKPTAKKTEKPAAKKTEKPDDFKKIEGIGPKIASLINDAGITTFDELSKTDPEKVREILLAAGNRYKMHDPTTWPKQAGMAAEGKWDELKAWQGQLDGGK